MGPDALDFWIGSWDCTWDGGAAVNRVTRELRGAVIVERFEATAPETFAGISISVFERASGVWHQTWMDSDANHWTLVGSRADGDVAFATPEPVDDERLYKRMVFSDIRPDRFHWRWEGSPDGLAWTERWAIEYRRRTDTEGQPSVVSNG